MKYLTRNNNDFLYTVRLMSLAQTLDNTHTQNTLPSSSAPVHVLCYFLRKVIIPRFCIWVLLCAMLLCILYYFRYTKRLSNCVSVSCVILAHIIATDPRNLACFASNLCLHFTESICKVQTEGHLFLLFCNFTAVPLGHL
jgi:hypothetical protein